MSEKDCLSHEIKVEVDTTGLDEMILKVNQLIDLQKELIRLADILRQKFNFQ